MESKIDPRPSRFLRIESVVAALCFVLLALPLGVLLAVIVPRGQNADETAHIMRADGLARGEVMGHAERGGPAGRPPAGVGFDIDPALMWLGKMLPEDGEPRLRPDTLVGAEHIAWFGPTTFTRIGTIASYLPVFYIPGAAAIAAGRALGLSPYDAFTAARLLNVLSFVAIGAAALLVARRGRPLLLAALTLPMTASLSASAGGDAQMLAAIVLAVALVTRAEARAAARDPARPAVSREPSWIAAAAIVAVVAAVKVPYLPLAAILLVPLPPFRAWRGEAAELLRRVSALGVVAMVCAAWVLLQFHQGGEPAVRALYEAGPLWPGARPAPFAATDMAAQLHVLLAHPMLFVTLPAEAVIQNQWTLKQAVGVLGWLNVVLPAPIYTMWFATLAAASLGCLFAPRSRASDANQLADFGLLALMTLVATWLIYISQYLSWTNVGYAAIDGVQGRYLIPFIPVVALALPRLAMPGRRTIYVATLAATVAAGAVSATAVVATVVDFYYVS